MVAALPLDTVAHVAGSQDEGYDQHRGIELPSHEADEAEAPQGRQRAGDYRRPPSAAPALRQVQHQNHHRHGEQEEDGDGRLVVVAVAAHHRFAGHEDPVVLVLVLGDDGADLLEQSKIVQPALVERSRHHRRLVVGAHQPRDFAPVGKDMPFEFLDSRLGCGNLGVHVGHDVERAGLGLDIAHAIGGEREDLVMVDTRKAVDRLLHVLNLVQGIEVEDVAVSDLDHEGQALRAAVSFPLVVGANVGMVGGEEIHETSGDLDLRGVVTGGRADREQRDPDRRAKAQNQPADNTVRIGAHLTRCHWYPPSMGAQNRAVESHREA